MEFNSLPELRSLEYCVNEYGELVLRDEYETECEIREAVRDEREQLKRNHHARLLLAVAVGMFACLMLLQFGR